MNGLDSIGHLLPPNPINSLLKQCSAIQLMGRGVKTRLDLARDATENTGEQVDAASNFCKAPTSYLNYDDVCKHFFGLGEIGGNKLRVVSLSE